ncbi:MAG: site-2 protease family protein [Betaproteobacteria bacterium]|nr:site-2 protease family protein [Betaproteobacteria bacterium]MBI3938187.1 site-2 protease family protein [Betaproteobacteria bacterium]
MELNLIQAIAIYALPVVFAITLHEAAHGYVAKHFGDLTAYAEGRVSLNPLRHIDPVGTVLVPLVLLMLTKLFTGGGILFGWAKPVPVNFGNLRHPKRDMLWVAAAGPLSNFAMALVWASLLKLGLAAPGNYFAPPLALMGAAGVFVNVIFMVLNLLPLPPLDGGRIVVSLLPYRMAYQFSRIEPYGFLILLMLLFSGLLGVVMWPMIGAVMSLISYLFDVPPADLIRLINLI